MKKLWKRIALLQIAGVMAFICLMLAWVLILPAPVQAQSNDFTSGFALPDVKFDFEKQENQLFQPLQLIMYMTIVSIAPYIIVCTTSFIRITVIFSFMKTSLGTSHAPSNQIWMGLAMCLTLFIMAPVGARMEKEAIDPYKKGKIQYNEFKDKMQRPVLDFMKANTRTKDLRLFVFLSKTKNKEQMFKNPPMHIIIPAFIISELRVGFYCGFIMYLPFLCIDMITASVLMSMGMFMLSPMGISMPLKVLTFCMIDGWELLVEGIVKSYRY